MMIKTKIWLTRALLLLFFGCNWWMHVVGKSNGSSDTSQEIERFKRAYFYGKISRLWPNGVVPYTIVPDMPDWCHSNIMEAFERFHNNTCVRFVPRTIETDYINITRNNHGDCSSLTGRQRHGGMQTVQLNTNERFGEHLCCMSIGSVQHELMHVIGFRHEQQRRDRMLYVAFEKEPPDADINFGLRQSQQTQLPCKYGYDYQSVMHYHWGGLMRPMSKNPAQLPAEYVGQRNNFSTLDILKIRLLYHCSPEDVCTSADFERLEQILKSLFEKEYEALPSEEQEEIKHKTDHLWDWLSGKIESTKDAELQRSHRKATKRSCELRRE